MNKILHTAFKRLCLLNVLSNYQVESLIENELFSFDFLNNLLEFTRFSYGFVQRAIKCFQ